MGRDGGREETPFAHSEGRGLLGKQAFAITLLPKHVHQCVPQWMRTESVWITLHMQGLRPSPRGI